jgi:hypothetical protein
MRVVGHDDEGVELETVLLRLIEEDVDEELGVLFDLKEPAAGCAYGGYEVGPYFLGGEWHGRKRPGAEAPFLWMVIRRAKALR